MHEFHERRTVLQRTLVPSVSPVSTLRRYSELKPSAGTQWPPDVRKAIEDRDPWCVGAMIGFGPATCFGSLQLDHVRASGGVGMKSASTLENGARLCSWHHRYKTEHGREVRPLLLDYIASRADPHAFHVDPCPGCLR